MKRFSATVVAAALAAVTAVAVVKLGWRWGDGIPAEQVALPAAAPHARPACAFKPGERAAFSIQSTVQALGAPGDGDLFKAVLSWEVLPSPDPDEWLLSAAFSSVELRQTLSRPEQRVAQPLGRSFMLRIGRDCRFTAKGFPTDWTPTTRRFVFTIIAGLEFALAPARPGLSWEIEQVDGLGRYDARYDAIDLPGGGLQMAKVKTRYLGDNRVLGLDIQVQALAARADGTLDPSGRWLRKASGREEVRLSVQGNVLAVLEQRYELRRDDARFASPDPGVERTSVDWQDPFTMVVAAVEPPVGPEIAKLSLDQALEQFAAIYGRTANGDAYNAALFLAQWLKARPERAATMLEALRSGGIPETLRPASFLALERCGTPEARAVLMEALADDSMTDMDRARAASALSDVPEPTLESARALVAAASDASQSQMVTGTSVRALGHLAERARTLDPEMQQEIQKVLDDELAAAPDDSRAIDVVDAIGNSGDAAFIPQMEDRLADESPLMREHAARALRGMGASEAMEPLLARLEVETDPRVQTALVDTLTTLAVQDSGAIALANEQLAAQPAPEVRLALIRWLGAAAATVPAAREGLVAQFHREPVPQLQQMIGRYVAADELH